MKNLFFVMMAILLINVSYAADEMGESQKADCVDGIQSSRFQEQVQDGEAVVKSEDGADSASAQ